MVIRPAGAGYRCSQTRHSSVGPTRYAPHARFSQECHAVTSTAVRARRTQSSLSHDYDLRAGPSARLASSHVPLTQPGDARRGTRDAGTSTHGTSHVAVACLIHVEHLDNTAKLPQSETAYRDHVHHRSGPVTTQSMSSVCGLCLCGARLCCAVYAAAGRGVERASRATSAPPRSWSMAHWVEGRARPCA